MRNKILSRGALGFLLGAGMMYIVPSLINRTPVTRVLYSAKLLARVGSQTGAALTTLLVIGLFGALCLCGTLFYEIERWPLALATAAHYLTISLGYLIVERLLCWEIPPKLLLIIEGFMTLGFFLIWLCIYLRYKAEVRRLNELIRDQVPQNEAGRKE